MLRTTFLLLLAVGLPTQTVASQVLVFPQREALLSKGNTAESAAVLQHLQQAAPLSSEAQLLDMLAAIPDSLTPITADWVLATWAEQQRQMTPTPALRAAVSWLRSYQDQTRVAHSHQADYGVPLYNVAAIARGTENHWQWESTRYWAQAAIAAKNTQFLTTLPGQPDAPTLSALSITFGAQHTPLSMRQQLSELIEGNAAYARVALAAAIASQDEALFKQALLRAPALRVDSLATATTDWPLVTAVRLLEEWLPSTDATAASVALTSLAQVEGHPANSAEYLLKQLDDSRLGATAARLLAQRSETTWVVEASAKLAAEPGSHGANRAALALRLAPHAAAKEAIDRLPSATNRGRVAPTVEVQP